jgi:hypothetical protein
MIVIAAELTYPPDIFSKKAPPKSLGRAFSMYTNTVSIWNE